MIDEPAPGQHPPPSFLFANLSVSDVRRLAAFAERAGARRAWLAETNGAELASTAGALAASTGLELGSAIISVFSRTPAVVAMLASTVAAASGHPFTIGIGAGGQAIVERWNGLPYERTVERTRDFIAIVRESLAGRRTDHDGAVLSSHGFELAAKPPGCPILLGTIGERMTRLAVEAADGLILTWASPRMVAAHLGWLRGLLAESGHDAAAFRVVGRMYACVADDADDVDAIREEVRRELVTYLASPPYGRYFERHGFGSEVAAVRRAFAAGDRSASIAAVSDRMLGDLFTTGTAAEVRTRAEAYWATGIDDLMVQLVPGAGTDAAEATIRALL